MQETWIRPLGREDPFWRRAWQPTPVFLPGEFHGQKSLAGYSPWGHKESDKPDQLTLSLFYFFLLYGWWMKVTQLCLTLCNPKDYKVHGILQARILEWVAFPFSRGFSQPRDWTQVSCIAGRFFTSWVIREAQWKLCLTLCDPMDYKVHGILQARILKWVAFPFCRGSSQLTDRTQISHTACGFFTQLREGKPKNLYESINIKKSYLVSYLDTF